MEDARSPVKYAPSIAMEVEYESDERLKGCIEEMPESLQKEDVLVFSRGWNLFLD
jgi:hypothetical protein